MRNVVLHLSMSLDGLVGSDRERGVAIPVGDELELELERVGSAGAHPMGRVSYQAMSS
ncbi:protein of unknown function [Modestobacter italicus]|uniref:Uncharacterized protein n=1 Tax=Modestobacter italicus (strain DSM 44449 / CECT 9708 / BC 501) TaxID=2732864 RepID=I4F0X7_MODI5|nr:hypothetical protein [Modestobacter marinus]CCH89290.1 protein of unknown function [Modestobacter marinus]